MYYPFAKQLERLEYADIESFCKQGVAENLFLDYKEELKGEKLSKSIASFANTKGGLLLIGVHEDKTTKQPSKWDGINDTGTLSEQINAEIANVVPYPTCRFAIVPHKTKGKAFVVLIVQEGTAAPYFTVHKPIVWVRTGDISTPIGQSNRADLITLTERGKAANDRIESMQDIAEHLFNERYERAKDAAIAASGGQSAMMALTTETAILSGPHIPLVTSSIIPQNPEEIADQKTLYDQQHDFRYDKPHLLIPPMNVHLEPVRYGIVTQNDHAFSIDREQIRYMYVSKYGLLQFRHNIHERVEGVERHNLFRVLHCIANTLRYASTFYSHFGYSGTLRLIIEMENLDKEVLLLGSTNIMTDRQTVPLDLYSYDWSVDLSTHDLTTDKTKSLLTKLYTDIYLDLGFGSLPSEARKIIDEFNI